VGAQGDGCAASSRSPAPDVTGIWDVGYDDIAIGGAVYTAELGAAGGVVTITHQGRSIRFDLDCARRRPVPERGVAGAGHRGAARRRLRAPHDRHSANPALRGSSTSARPSA